MYKLSSIFITLRKYCKTTNEKIENVGRSRSLGKDVFVGEGGGGGSNFSLLISGTGHIDRPFNSLHIQ